MRRCGDDAGVVVVAFALVHQRHDQPLNDAGEGQRHLIFFGGLQGIPQIFLVEANPEARLEIARDRHRRFGVQNRASGQTAFDGVENHFRIEARFGG